MAEQLSRQEQIQQLILLGDAARSRLSTEAHSLRNRLDVPARLRDSLKSHPSGWLFGSLASGLAASLLFRRKPATIAKKPRGLPTALLGLTLTAVRPLAKIWLTGQLKNYVAANLAPSPVRRAPAHPPTSQNPI